MKILKYAWRYLTRSKSYTIINLLGLSLSLACCIILLRYIHRELTVDTNCVDRNNVYGIKMSVDNNEYLGGILERADTVHIDPRNISCCTRVIPLEKEFIKVDNHRFSAKVIATDSAFFQLFHYSIKQGTNSLSAPQSALLMEPFARKLFGKSNPIGKIIQCSNGKDVTVSGILTEPKNKTTLNFDMVLSLSLSEGWSAMAVDFYSFFPGIDINRLNKTGSIPHYVNRVVTGDSRQFTYVLIPVKQIYWEGSIVKERSGIFSSGSFSHLLILAGVCLMMFLAGILNFVNIYMVTMLKRGKEYGLKKVFGAKGKDLFIQIWTENMLLVSAALLAAWAIIELSAVPISHLFDYRFNYTAFDWRLSLAVLLLLPLLTSVYPFLKYNYSSPMVSIRSIGQGKKSVLSRIVFLGVQYVLTFLLIVLSLYFNKQLKLLLDTQPGFRTKDIIVANLVYESTDYSSYNPVSMEARMQRVAAMDNLVSACPDIEDFEPSYADILNGDQSFGFYNDKGEKIDVYERYCTPRFFNLYKIKFVEGDLRNVDKNSRVWVANRAALKALHYSSCKDAMIKPASFYVGTEQKLEPVVAVVDDYYDGHLSLGKKPIIFGVGDSMGGDVYQIACVSGKVKNVIKYLHKAEKEVYGTEDFDYSLLEDNVSKLYEKDRQVADIYSLFAFIAIVISSLGLFGISLFDIRQRYREIAIRKVNGAQINDLYRLLLRKYLTVLGISFVLAIPIAYYIIYEYTKDFVVKAPITIGIFLIGLVIVAAISICTLLWQIRKAANINPSEVMKTE